MIVKRCAGCGKVHRCSGALCIECIVKENPNWPRRAPHIVEVHAKDEGDFYFLTTLTQADLDHRAGGAIGVPYDPNRVRAHGTLADAEALAAEHGARLVIT